jgi:hypothetical protein
MNIFLYSIEAKRGTLNAERPAFNAVMPNEARTFASPGITRRGDLRMSVDQRFKNA